tara:strand:+ start:3973 stop:4242 length:270 start_codon:yes stop_codon:yes gene_type:complete
VRFDKRFDERFDKRFDERFEKRFDERFGARNFLRDTFLVDFSPRRPKRFLFVRADGARGRQNSELNSDAVLIHFPSTDVYFLPSLPVIV